MEKIISNSGKSYGNNKPCGGWGEREIKVGMWMVENIMRLGGQGRAL
jgi:hypothetical protein